MCIMQYGGAVTHRNRTRFVQHNKIVVKMDNFDWMIKNWRLMPFFGCGCVVCVCVDSFFLFCFNKWQINKIKHEFSRQHTTIKMVEGTVLWLSIINNDEWIYVCTHLENSNFQLRKPGTNWIDCLFWFSALAHNRTKTVGRNEKKEQKRNKQKRANTNHIMEWGESSIFTDAQHNVQFYRVSSDCRFVRKRARGIHRCWRLERSLRINIRTR